MDGISAGEKRKKELILRILTIDIGNTAVKGSVFEDGKLLESILLETRDAEAIGILARRHSPDGAICCCVGQDADDFVAEMETETGLEVMQLTHDTPLPIDVKYATPGTLGLDRIAAAAGASLIADNAIVVDAGTAITLDIVCGNTFSGGNISPGMRLRFRSLNHYTSRLPLVPPAGSLPSFGYDTETAIRSGVVNGIVAEIASAWRAACAEYPGMHLLLTGGDADFLAPLLREKGVELRQVSSLVGLGLERIFRYNK